MQNKRWRHLVQLRKIDPNTLSRNFHPSLFIRILEIENDMTGNRNFDVWIVYILDFDMIILLKDVYHVISWTIPLPRTLFPLSDTLFCGIKNTPSAYEDPPPFIWIFKNLICNSPIYLARQSTKVGIFHCNNTACFWYFNHLGINGEILGDLRKTPLKNVNFNLLRKKNHV